MTPKEKSEELVSKFCTEYTTWNHANKCALVAVEEMIKVAKDFHEYVSYEETTDYEGGEKKVKYLLEVKQELEKL